MPLACPARSAGFNRAAELLFFIEQPLCAQRAMARSMTPAVGGDGSISGALPPSVSLRNNFSTTAGSPLWRRVPGVFSVDLLTATVRETRKFSLLRPVLFEAMDLGDLVRFSETKEIYGF